MKNIKISSEDILDECEIEDLVEDMNFNSYNSKQSNFKPIQDYINIYDNSIVWFYLEGFNGYELSNTNIVRSMKHYKKYPYGLLIMPNKSGIYELSNNRNQRVKISLEELQLLAAKRKYAGYPRGTMMTDVQSRNPNISSLSEYKQKRNAYNETKFDTTLSFPKFTILK